MTGDPRITSDRLRQSLMAPGAGRDACSAPREVPAAMTCLHCKDGPSNNDAEWAEPELLTAGCNILFQAAFALSPEPVV